MKKFQQFISEAKTISYTAAKKIMANQKEQLHRLFREMGIDKYTHRMPPMGEEDMGPHTTSYEFIIPLAVRRKVNGKMQHLQGELRIFLNRDTNYPVGEYHCHAWFQDGGTDEIEAKTIDEVRKFIEKYEYIFNPKIKIQKRFDL